MPFVYAPLTVFLGLQENPSLLGCKIMFTISSVLVAMNMMFAEAIMFIRLHAIGGHGRVLGAWLLFQFVGVHVSVFVFVSLFLRSVNFIKSPMRSVHGCLPHWFDTKTLFVVFVLIVASQLTIMILSAWIGVRKYRNSTSSVLTVFYRDGLFYFISLAAVTVGNMIFDQVAPPALSFMLSIPQGVLHSILSCRLILHLYEFAQRELYGSSAEKTKTALEFVHNSPTTTVDAVLESRDVDGNSRSSGVAGSRV
ncbi:hypothetical protein FA15DRAFT_665259 [Coprinopsis marcescibilis]|uniref:Uncharacterized protein n=1 Tax=Coprinopsis marcescibilis TaxID=230819 RepID=A0A5C3L7C5_COPMA|nr:hypothetical protein FA15DRAFT_665259 [Coprinopsis marcescibilis]